MVNIVYHGHFTPCFNTLGCGQPHFTGCYHGHLQYVFVSKAVKYCIVISEILQNLSIYLCMGKGSNDSHGKPEK